MGGEKLLLFCYILKEKQGQGNYTRLYNIWEVSSAQLKLNILMYKLGEGILTVYIKCFPDEQPTALLSVQIPPSILMHLEKIHFSHYEIYWNRNIFTVKKLFLKHALTLLCQVGKTSLVCVIASIARLAEKVRMH